MRRKTVIFVLVFVSCLGVMPEYVSARSSAGIALITHDWTYFAIEDLVVDRGIAEISVPDELNRNQGALLVARLLQHLSGEDHLESRRFGLAKNVYLDNMIFSYNQRVTPTEALSERQVELLYRLVLEFQQELEILGYAIQDFSLLEAEYGISKPNGVFGGQALLYSEQALAAARKAEEVRGLIKEPDALRESSTESTTPRQSEPPRNLWTGQFSQVRNLPPSSSIVVQQNEEQYEEEQPMFQLGGIEISGGLRASFADAHDADEDGSGETGAGYGISLKMGELALKTAVDLAVHPSLIPKAASTSVDLSLDWADLFTLSAGIRQRGLLSGEWATEDEEEFLPVVTSLGLVVPIRRGQLQLGMTQEWNKPYRFENPGTDNDGSPARNIAELDLSYDFDGESSLHFNYKLIDFSDVGRGDSQTQAEAKFSIKF